MLVGVLAVSAFVGSACQMTKPQAEAWALLTATDVNPDRLIVQLTITSEPGAKTYLVGQGLDIETKLGPPFQNTYIVRPKPNGKSLFRAACDLLADSETYGQGPVVRVEADQVIRLLDVPNDELFSQQWGLSAVNPADVGNVRAPEGWVHAKGVRRIRVAVIDSGVHASHPDLADAVEPGTDYVKEDDHGMVDLYGHGTRVAGILAARASFGTEPRVGIAGVAPRVLIYPIRVMQEGTGFLADVLKALTVIESEHIRVSCNSWYMEEDSEFLHDAIADLGKMPLFHTFVCAAGNTGKDLGSSPVYPAAYKDLPNLIAVGASQPDGTLASFSSRGRPEVDIAAPGVNILSTIPPASWSFGSGTSFAAPFVAGGVALLLSERGFMPTSPGEVRDRVVSTAHKFAALEPYVEAEGILDLEELLK